MKSIFKYILMLALLLAFGCTKDEIESPKDLESALDEDSSTTSFNLYNDIATLQDGLDQIEIHLTQHSTGDYTNLKAVVEYYEEYSKLHINYTETIEDGDYTLRLESSALLESSTNTKSDGMDDLFIHLTIEDMKVIYASLFDHTVSSSYTPTLSGDGLTAETAYIISSTDEFDIFKYWLSSNPDGMTGKYFAQTASFEAPIVSCDYEGNYLSCYSFGGHYEGNGNTITGLYYNGDGTSTSNIGLFAQLVDGAVVQNLNLEVSYYSAYDNCGGLAGKASGPVTVSNVFVKGSISGRNTLGGVIGYVKGATLTMTDCSIQMSVSGAVNIGGFLGCIDNSSKVTLNTLNNINPDTGAAMMTTVTGSSSNVGGVVGAITSSEYSFSNIYLENAVSEQQKETKYIQSASKYCGGVAGVVQGCSASTLTDIDIRSTVHADGNEAGGLIGYANLSSSLTFKNCYFGSYVTGNECVGGFIGSVSGGEHLVFSTVNNISETDGGGLGVEGTNNVGGLIGSGSGKISFADSVKVNINVTASVSNVGGCIGIHSDGTLDCTNYICDNNMTVTGSMTVGGMVGYLKGGANIKGALPDTIKEHISSNSGIPAESYYTAYTTYPGKVIASSTYAGGIVGYMDGTSSTARNLVFTGTVSCGGHCGGIIGHVAADSSIYDNVNCSGTLGKSSCDGTRVGGIVGAFDVYNANISYCINYGDISVSNHTDGSVGGCIGYITSIGNSIGDNINNLINVGNLSGCGSVAGIIGVIHETNNYITLNEMANFGSITNTSGDFAGGIVGKAAVKHITYESCANHGKIYGSSSTYVAGIASYVGVHSGTTQLDNVKVLYCCNTGEICSGKSEAYIGGILGLMGESDATNGKTWGMFDCYNSGHISSNHDADTGGLVGYLADQCRVERGVNTGMVGSSSGTYYGNGTIGTHGGGSVIYTDNLYFLSGTGKDWKGTSFSATNKGNNVTFNDFDFTSVWEFTRDASINNGAPYLRDCPYQNMSCK